jgi:predicted dehydrogenase
LDQLAEVRTEEKQLLLDNWTKFDTVGRMAPELLRVGIAGSGFIGRVHARSARLAGGHLVSVAASSPESAEAATAEFGAEWAAGSAEELVASPDVDVIHICTPNHLHRPLAEAALAAGKHVICEKPLGLDAAEAEALTAAADESGRETGVPFVYRFYPTVREAHERVARGELGTITLLHGTYLQDWLLRPQDYNWRVDEATGGASRAFADIGSHWCDLAEFVSGQRITSLSARTLTAVRERVSDSTRRAFGGGDSTGESRAVGTEDIALVQFQTDGGALGSVVISQVSAGRKNRLWLELDGSESALAFDQEQPEQLWVGRREAESIVRRDPESLSRAAARYATLPGGHPQGYADCFDAFVADFYESIRTGLRPAGLPVFADGLRAVRITEAVLRSAATGEWVDVASVEEAVAR